jgi:hypothetical protein
MFHECGKPCLNRRAESSETIALKTVMELVCVLGMVAFPRALAEARKYYREDCAVCHPDDGTGETALAAGLSPELPELHADHIQKLTDGEILYVIFAKDGPCLTAAAQMNKRGSRQRVYRFRI